MKNDLKKRFFGKNIGHTIQYEEITAAEIPKITAKFELVEAEALLITALCYSWEQW